MKYGSVCSGIEAATQAWHPLGWEPEFFSEIEKFPCEVLAHHYGSNMPDEEHSQNGVPNYGDMTNFKEWPDHGPSSDRPIDLLVGGTPCQSFSIAGLRKGLSDPRGNLMLTYLSIARRYQPKWVVWENVPGVLSSFSGAPDSADIKETGWEGVEESDFASLLRGLEECGYSPAWRVLDAQFTRVDGYGRAVPQRRRRLFVVGYLGDWRRAAAVLFDGESMSGNPTPRRETGQDITRDVGKGLRGGSHWRGSGCHPSLNQSNNVGGIGMSNQELFSQGGSGLVSIGPVAFNSREDPEVTFDRSGSLSAGSPQSQAVAFDMRGRDGGSQLEGPHATANIRAADGGSSRSYVAAPLMAGMAASAQRLPDEQGALVDVKYGVRRLMPVECERLQGFPDGFTQIPYRNKPVENCPDGPRYKALGNSMAVNCMRYLGQRIAIVDKMS